MVRFTFLDVETSFRLCIVSSSSHTSLPTASLSLSEKVCSYHPRSLVQTGLILTQSSLASYLGNNSYHLSPVNSEPTNSCHPAHILSREFLAKKLVKNVLGTGRMYWVTGSNGRPVLRSVRDVSTNHRVSSGPSQIWLGSSQICWHLI